jgi:hypothetical protein
MNSNNNSPNSRKIREILNKMAEESRKKDIEYQKTLRLLNLTNRNQKKRVGKEVS